MNAFSQKYELTLERRQVEEAVASVFHTLLLHRSVGKFNYLSDVNYTVDALGTEDVDCDYVDLSYVRLNTEKLSSAVQRRIAEFRENLRQHDDGEIVMQFFEKKRRSWPLSEENIPWELWILKIIVVQLNNESEHQMYRESVGDALSDIIYSICRDMNRSRYVPKMPSKPDLPLIFDIGYDDVQPYLHNITHEVRGPSAGSSFSSAVQKLIKLSM